MHENVRYVVDKAGKKRGVIVPMHVWKKLNASQEKSRPRFMDRKKLKKYVGRIRLATDPLKFQKAIRREW